MTLEEHLDDIRSNLRHEVFLNEASVSQGIVLRLLHALGWPSFDPQVIIPEYSVEGRRVDFALCDPPLEPLVFIEVKQVGQIEGAERQLFEYAFHRGVPIAILTDGREWYFFHPGGQGNYQERRVCELDLIETGNHESSGWLNKYLNYESIRTREAIGAIEEDYRNVSRQRQIETRLPEAWSRLVEKVDELLIEVVAEKTEGLCGHRPTNEQVLTFLRSLGREVPPLPAPAPIMGAPPLPAPGPIGPAEPRRRRPPTRLDVIMPNGERINHHTAIQTFAEVIKQLGINRVRRVYPDLISSSQSRQHGYQVGEYYMRDQTSTRAKKQILERIAGLLRIQLEVRIISSN